MADLNILELLKYPYQCYSARPCNLSCWYCPSISLSIVWSQGLGRANAYLCKGLTVESMHPFRLPPGGYLDKKYTDWGGGGQRQRRLPSEISDIVAEKAR